MARMRDDSIDDSWRGMRGHSRILPASVHILSDQRRRCDGPRESTQPHTATATAYFSSRGRARTFSTPDALAHVHRQCAVNGLG